MLLHYMIYNDFIYSQINSIIVSCKRFHSLFHGRCYANNTISKSIEWKKSYCFELFILMTFFLLEMSQKTINVYIWWASFNSVKIKLRHVLLVVGRVQLRCGYIRLVLSKSFTIDIALTFWYFENHASQ